MVADPPRPSETFVEPLGPTHHVVSRYYLKFQEQQRLAYLERKKVIRQSYSESVLGKVATEVAPCFRGVHESMGGHCLAIYLKEQVHVRINELNVVMRPLLSLWPILVFPKFGNEVFCFLIEPFHRLGYILRQAPWKTFGD